MHTLTKVHMGVCVCARVPAGYVNAPFNATNTNVLALPGRSTSGSLLANAVAPPGTALRVGSFGLQGDASVTMPSTVPFQLADPVSRVHVGSIVVLPNGTYTFTPSPGFEGPVPELKYTLASSNGQTASLALTIKVQPLLLVPNTQLTGAGSRPSSANVLTGAVVPPGTNVSVAGFSLPGSITTYPAGPAAVAVTDPATGQAVGSVVVLPSGIATFTPAPGFEGQAPPITIIAASSDGQVNPSTLSVVYSAMPGVCARHMFL